MKRSKELIALCHNCGARPDTTGREDDSPYLAKVWSIKRQEEMWVCYNCFIAVMDSINYKAIRAIIDKRDRDRV